MQLTHKIALCMFVCLCSLEAQVLPELQQVQQSKLEAAIRTLNEQRSEIQKQQVPLVQKLNQLEAQARELREQLHEARRLRDSRSMALETLKSTIAAQRESYEYISRTLLNDYSSRYESLLSTGELDTYGNSIRELNLFLENPEATEAARLQRSLALFDESLRRIDSIVGGKQYAGESLTEKGLVVDGTFIQLGPLLYFSDASGRQAGIVKETNLLQARVVTIDKKSGNQIAALASGGSGSLPMDLSLGNAMALKGTREGFVTHLKKGGRWVYPIVAFALLSTLIALFKSVQILRLRRPKIDVIQDIVRLLHADKPAEAEKLAKAQHYPANQILIQGVKHAKASPEFIEEAMYETLLSTQPELEKYLNVIAVTASVAPLLGLLGTVTGIIKTFNLMSVFGAGDPKLLISGISEALITTELGLILAIPALVIYAILSRKVANTLARMEQLSVAFINRLSRPSESSEQ